MEITRAQFKDAIEFGISKAYALTPEHIEALRRVGELSDEFGLTYSTGCPAAQAGIYVADIEPSTDNNPGIQFAWRFDDYLYRHLSVGSDDNRVQVRD
jgi:hypothetical protein